MIKEKNLNELRHVLEDERIRLLKKAGVDVSENGWEGIENPDRSDLARDYSQLDRQTTLAAMEEQKLNQIEEALYRLKIGTYGQCSNCGKAIQLERLEAVPYATLCIECQRSQADH